jgi:hypothetical protein
MFLIAIKLACDTPDCPARGRHFTTSARSMKTDLARCRREAARAGWCYSKAAGAKPRADYCPACSAARSVQRTAAAARDLLADETAGQNGRG